MRLQNENKNQYSIDSMHYHVSKLACATGKCSNLYRNSGKKLRVVHKFDWELPAVLNDWVSNLYV